MPFRVAVLGSSQATGYGLAEQPDLRRRDRAFPGLLGADPSSDFEVVSHARDGHNIDMALALLDEIAAWRPDVVVCVTGGRESLVRRSRLVERIRRPIPVKGIPQTPRPRGVEWAKTVPWRVVVWLVNRESRAVEWAGARVGLGPEMPAADYAQALTAITRRVIDETSAHVLLMPRLGGWRGEFPAWRYQRVAINAVSERLAASSPRVTLLPIPDVNASTDLWLPDGSHLTEAGHAHLAQWLAAEIRAVTG